MTIRAGFFGTPAAAVPSLAALARVTDICMVVTRRDRPRGRSGRPQPSPVKVAAQQWGFRVAQPARAGDIAADLAALELDVAVVAAYGQLLPPPLLGSTRRGFVNVHFSLLPRWRGAAPVERALLAGDAMTGVSLMVLDEGLDTGPIFAQQSVEIGGTDTAGSLTARLAALGGALLADQLSAYVADRLMVVAQDDTAATAAPKIDPAEAHIDFTMDAPRMATAIRAFNPRPGAWADTDTGRFKILAAAATDPAAGSLPPGSIVVDGKQVLMGTATTPLRLVTVQPAGKAPMDAAAWAHGQRGVLPTLT